jgi:hypothetical protein
MLEQKLFTDSEPETLVLQSCPPTVQLMPVEVTSTRHSLLLSVVGNTLVGILLFGVLMSVPGWLAGFLYGF